MEEPLYTLLEPYFSKVSSESPAPSLGDLTTSKYLNRLSILSLDTLQRTEPQSLAQSAYSNLLAIQALATRSSKPIINSASHLQTIHPRLTELTASSSSLLDSISTLDTTALSFATKYARNASSPILDARKRALLLSQNVDRLSSILELPSLLSSAISNSALTSASGGAASSMGYNSALDLQAHIKRLHTFYPSSGLLASIHDQGDIAMQGMLSNLINSLQAPGLKLAAAMRTIGYLRRMSSELSGSNSTSGEGLLGALFLSSRLANLTSTIDALEPLRELADQETHRREAEVTNGTQEVKGTKNLWASGQQTERYLKRYIEIFREHSFAAISMFRSIFPADEAQKSNLDSTSIPRLQTTLAPRKETKETDNPLLPLPSALASFPLHLVDMLSDELRTYLPNVREKAARESLFTQVLYCAGSLSRLGADFSLVLAGLCEIDGDEDEEDKHDGLDVGLDREKRMGDENEKDEVNEDKHDDSEQTEVTRQDYRPEEVPEWIAVMKKHRVLAGKLELLASGGGSGR